MSLPRPPSIPFWQGHSNRSAPPSTHRCSQQRQMRPSCRLRRHRRNSRRRCKGHPTHQHHAVSSADAPAARGGSRQVQRRRSSAQATLRHASGPSHGDGATMTPGTGPGRCGLVAVRDEDRNASGSCGHRGGARREACGFGERLSLSGTFVSCVERSNRSVACLPTAAASEDEG